MPKSQSNVLDVLEVQDPDLPLLAAEAALELDNVAKLLPTTLSATLELGAKIKNSICIDPNGPTKQALMNVGTLDVLGRAIQKLPETQIHSIRDLVDQAWQLAQGLSHADPTSTVAPPDIMLLRDFCLALANCSASYFESINGPINAYPFRETL